MTSVSYFRSFVCAAAIMSANGAHADVTAAEVWENWKASLSLYGEDGVSIGEEIADGDQLTVNGLVLTMEDSDVSIVSNIGTIVFAENGDGTVSVTMQDSYDVEITNPNGDGSAQFAVNQQNMSIVVSGVPDAMNYEVSADSYEFRLIEAVGDGEDIDGDAFMTLRDLSGSYQTETGDRVDTTFDFAAGSLDMLMDFKEPGGDEYVVLSGKLDGMSATGRIDLPADADMSDPDSYGTDFTFQSTARFDGAGFIFDTDIEGSAAQGSIETGAVVLSSDVNPETLGYTFSFADTAVTVQSSDLPVPVVVSWDLVENTLAMPVSATDDSAPFSFTFALGNVAVNDEIWDMGDPSGTLPRDPASLIIDISGMARLFFDLMDPEQAEALALADVPGELYSLSLNILNMSAVGLDVSADGAFTFDNTDLETFDGLPRPMGELNVGITGANAMLDTLVSMGLVPQEQATMGRMFMGMFTQPAGDDVLTSKIEINEEGHIMANGQRIQ